MTEIGLFSTKRSNTAPSMGASYRAKISEGLQCTTSRHLYIGGMGGYAPAHYLKQFHPKYTSKEDHDKKLTEAKFDKWWLLFLDRNSWHLNPELPVVTPWKTV